MSSIIFSPYYLLFVLISFLSLIDSSFPVASHYETIECPDASVTGYRIRSRCNNKLHMRLSTASFSGLVHYVHIHNALSCFTAVIPVVFRGCTVKEL